MDDISLTPPSTVPEILGSLGTFWSSFYPQSKRTELLGMFSALTNLWGDIEDHIRNVTDCLSRETAPALATQRICRVELSSDTRGTVARKYGESELLYDAVASYGSGAGISYLCDPTLVYVPFLANRITRPSRVLTYGNDFTIHQGKIHFRVDPAEDSSWSRVEDVTGAYSVYAWGWGARYDRRYGYRYAGYSVGVSASTSPRTKSIAAAAGHQIAGGASVGRLTSLISALTDAPVANADEVVELVGEDSRGTWIATPTQIYRIPQGATTTIQAGDTIRYGDSLSDQIRYASFNRGTVPDWLMAVVITPDTTGGQVVSPVVFLNEQVPLTFVTASGKLRFRFSLNTTPEAEEAFWRLIDAEEDATGDAWATYIKGDSGIFPATVNPAELVAQTILRRSTAAIQIGGKVRAGMWKLLSRATTAHARVIWYVSLPSQTEAADAAGDYLVVYEGTLPATEVATGGVDRLLPMTAGEFECDLT